MGAEVDIFRSGIPASDWTQELCLARAGAVQAVSMRDWSAKDSVGCKRASDAGWQYEIGDALGWPETRRRAAAYWTMERMIADAFGQDSYKAWRARPSYRAACKRKVQRYVGEKAGLFALKPNGHWLVYENCLADAKEQASYMDWIKRSSYQQANLQNWHHKIAREIGWME